MELTDNGNPRLTVFQQVLACRTKSLTVRRRARPQADMPRLHSPSRAGNRDRRRGDHRISGAGQCCHECGNDCSANRQKGMRHGSTLLTYGQLSCTATE